MSNNYNYIKQLWQQLIWNNGSKNVNLPEQINKNPFQYSLTNHFDTNKYTCGQCSYVSNEFIMKDTEKDKYCSVIGVNSSEYTKTLSCFPVQLSSTNTVKNVCKNCGSRKVVLEEKNSTTQTSMYKPFSNSTCKSNIQYNENEIKNCMLIDEQFLIKQNHSCRQNYCQVIHDTESNYIYKCSPVLFDSKGNIESVCTNSSLRKKQYTIPKTPEEQMFFRENQKRNEEIETYTKETFSNMLSDNMSIIEANERLKSLCGVSNEFISGYDKNRYTIFE